ncbi:MAG: hypothetical protein ABFE08_16240 [Armatimonadia bacterium]
MTTYCDAEGCENEATEVVPVSVGENAVEHRRYCYPCSAACHTGAQHARFRAIRRLTAHMDSLKKQGFVTEAGVIFMALQKLDTATDPGEEGVGPPPLDGPGDQ